MKLLNHSAVCFVCLCALALAPGCGSSDSKSKTAAPAANTGAPAAKSDTADSNKPAADAKPVPESGDAATDKDAAAKPFKLGDLLKPFTPPPLAEIDKTAEWIDNPVKSGMEMMRKKQEAEGPPAVSVAERLSSATTAPRTTPRFSARSAVWLRQMMQALRKTPPSCVTQAAI